MTNPSRFLQPSGKGSVEFDIHGSVLRQGQFCRAGAHAENTESDGGCVAISQCREHGLPQSLRLHVGHQSLFNRLSCATWQMDRAATHDDHTVEMRRAQDLGEQRLANRAGGAKNNGGSCGHVCSYDLRLK